MTKCGYCKEDIECLCFIDGKCVCQPCYCKHSKGKRPKKAVKKVLFRLHIIGPRVSQKEKTKYHLS